MSKTTDDLIAEEAFGQEEVDGPIFEATPREQLEKRVIAQAVMEALNFFEEYNELRAAALDEKRDFKLSIGVVIKNGYDCVSTCVSGSMKFKIEKTLDFDESNQMEFDFDVTDDGEDKI